MTNSRIIIEQIDPAKLVPGGTDTCISDLVKYSRPGEISIVGVTSDPSKKLGKWHTISFMNKEVQFLPVAFLDRGTVRSSRVRVPDSMRVILGAFRHRKSIPLTALQAHRVETGLMLSFLPRSKLIQFIHNDAAGLTGQNSDSIWKRMPRLYKWIEQRVLQKADVVVLFNKTDSGRIAKHFPALHVAQTWFDPQTFQMEARRTQLPPIRLVVIGRLESQKDPELAVEVLHELRQTTEATLTFVGDGSLRQSVLAATDRHGLKEFVTITGAIARSAVASLMNDSHVLLLCSHYEGSPRVLVEANATGLPVVATIGGDPDETLDGYSNGIRVSTRRPADLAAAIVAAAEFDREACASTSEPRSAAIAVPRLLLL